VSIYGNHELNQDYIKRGGRIRGDSLERGVISSSPTLVPPASAPPPWRLSRFAVPILTVGGEALSDLGGQNRGLYTCLLW
jgi:hypothetical protein